MELEARVFATAGPTIASVALKLRIAAWHPHRTTNRQLAVLRPTDWTAWIELTAPEAELLKPLPAGSLAVETVRPASD
jgi:putative SOS response-associated peptidase YedK